jgi:hypothetical protein
MKTFITGLFVIVFGAISGYLVDYRPKSIDFSIWLLISMAMLFIGLTIILYAAWPKEEKKSKTPSFIWLLCLGTLLMIVGAVGIFGHYYFYLDLFGEKWSMTTHYIMSSFVLISGFSLFVNGISNVLMVIEHLKNAPYRYEDKKIHEELTQFLKENIAENDKLKKHHLELNQENNALSEKLSEVKAKLLSCQGNFSQLQKKYKELQK